MNFQSLRLVSKTQRYQKIKHQAPGFELIRAGSESIAEVVKLVDTLP